MLSWLQPIPQTTLGLSDVHISFDPVAVFHPIGDMKAEVNAWVFCKWLVDRKYSQVLKDKGGVGVGWFSSFSMETSPQHYTPARKYYMIFVSELISRKKMSFQLHKNMLLELISRKLHYTYSFATQRITWKTIRELLLGKSHCSYTKVSLFCS